MAAGNRTLVRMAAVVLIVAAGVTIGLIGTAGAATGTVSPIGTITAGTPFSSGQTVQVSAPTGSGLPTGANVTLVECEAPNGVLPTLPSECDPSNTQSGDSINPAADGSFTYSNYQVYALPDPNLSPSTITCGDTLATECVVGMFDNYTDFTQPHIFSQPIGIAPSPSDDAANPGDGSLASAATTPSASLSTVSASSATAVADGTDPSVITVTLLGVNSSHATVPITGASVTLTGNSGTSSTITPSASTTDLSGQITFNVKDSAAEKVTYTAASGGVTVTETASVTFQAPVVSAVNSAVSPSATSEPADGASASTITVTVRDQGASPQPISGISVTLAQGSGSSVIAPSTAQVTDANGEVKFTVTDTTVETVVYAATAGGVVLTPTPPASVTFGTLVVSAPDSTVTAGSTSPPTGAGGGTTVVVTLRTAGGTFAVANKSVTLTDTGTNGGQVSPTTAQTTNAQGEVSFAVTDATVEQVTFDAVDVTDSDLAIGSISINFVAPTAPTVSASLSTVTFSPPTAPADGTTAFNVFVDIRNTANQPVVGDVVGITVANVATPGTNDDKVAVIPDTAAGATTPGETFGSNGQAEFQLRDTVAESIILTVTDQTASVTLTSSPTVTFTAGTTDGVQSTVAATPTAVAADGTTSSTVTVTLKDHFGNPVGGDSVSLDQGDGHSVISAPTLVTSASGVAAFTVTDTTNEYVTYEAVDTSDFNLVVSQTATVAFGAPPPIVPVAADCAIVTNLSSVPADGSSTATITVYLYDGSGNPVVGRTVTLTAAGGSSSFTATETSDTAGAAAFAVSDSHAESVTYSAVDTSDSVAVPDNVTVTFSPATVAAGAAASRAPLNHPVVGIVDTPDNGGYWLVASDGGVFTYGDASFEGSLGGTHLNSPIVGMASTPDGQGYWLVAADGGVFNFGDATFEGSLGGTHLNRPIVGMAPTPDGGGYWLVASDGGIFTFGDAAFHGALGGIHLNSPIVGMAATPDGRGYWMVAADGGVFTGGDAVFYGSMGDVVLNAPVVGIASTPDGQGYWLVASDGGIFTFGDAHFHGSAGAVRLNKPIIGMAATSDGDGYWLGASDGGIFTNDTRFFGSAA